jgi:hypothetical protein
MGRIREFIKVNGKKYWTFFDTRARNTYVVPGVASLVATSKLPKPFKSALGAKVRKVTRTAALVAQVEGYEVAVTALVIDEIGTGRGSETHRGVVWGIGHAMGDTPGP